MGITVIIRGVLALVFFAAMAGTVHAMGDETLPPLMMGASASMLSNTCAGCHGPDGVSAGPGVPTIAGIPAKNFESIMKAFKNGKAYATIMDRIARGYTDEEIEILARYYEKLPFRRAAQSIDEDAARKGAQLHQRYCNRCHSEAGGQQEDQASILAGQWRPYLDWTIHDVLDGKRDADQKMIKKLRELYRKEGDAGIDALINFYAGQK